MLRKMLPARMMLRLGSFSGNMHGQISRGAGGGLRACLRACTSHRQDLLLILLPRPVRDSEPTMEGGILLLTLLEARGGTFAEAMPERAIRSRTERRHYRSEVSAFDLACLRYHWRRLWKAHAFDKISSREHGS